MQFGKDGCVIKDHKEYNILAEGVRTSDNCYVIDPHSQQGDTCLLTQKDETNLWHQRLGHLNFRDLARLSKKGIVKDLPKLSKVDNPICKGCQMGSKLESLIRKLHLLGTTRPLELLHMDLAGPTRMESLGGKKYFMVVVDDFSRYTWVAFLREKSKAFNEFLNICKRIQVEKDLTIKRIQSDHGREFENHKFSNWCEELGVKHEFSAPKTPQQNGVAERKNRTLLNMATTMLSSKNIAKRFWAEAISIACYVSNRVYLRPGTSKTPYELWSGKKPTIKYFKVFGSTCYVLRDREHLGKFDEKSDEAMLLGYSTTSRAYRVYNIRTHSVEESINVMVDDFEATYEQGNLPVVLSDHENESSSQVEIEKSQGDQEEHSSQSSSEDEVEEIQLQPKDKRLTKGLS